MRKSVIILACILVGSTLFSGCTDRRGRSGQDTNAGSSVEVDDTDIVDTDIDAGTEHLPDGFTYSFKDPDSSGGIAVTPRA